MIWKLVRVLAFLILVGDGIYCIVGFHRHWPVGNMAWAGAAAGFFAMAMFYVKPWSKS